MIAWPRRAVLAGLLAGACRPADEPPAAVRVFAAASLTDVLPRALSTFAGPAPRLVFAASSTLARQIEQGAEAALFLSADEAWMDYLDERGLLLAGTRAALLTNTLVLVTPTGRPLLRTPLALAPGVRLAEVLGEGRLAVADPDSVPAGRYAKAALTSLGAWEAVTPKLVRAQDVRGALRLVELGEAAAGIVYATDARAAGASVAVVGEFPAGSHPAISYPMAILRSAPEAATDVAHHLRGPDAARAFVAAGFGLAAPL